MHSLIASSSVFFPLITGISGFIFLSVSDKNIFDLINKDLFWKNFVNNFILISSSYILRCCDLNMKNNKLVYSSFFSLNVSSNIFSKSKIRLYNLLKFSK